MIVILHVMWEEGKFAPFPKVFHQMNPLTRASFLREAARSDNPASSHLTQNNATSWRSAGTARYSSSQRGIQRQQRLETNEENESIWISLGH